MTDFTGQTALVTGAAARLGRSIALGLAGVGMRVVLHHHSSRDEVDSVAEEVRLMGVEAWVVRADFSKPYESEHLFEKSCGQAGGIDLLVNNASMFPEGRLDEFGFDALTANMAVNTYAPLALIRAFAAQQRGGSVVNLLDCRITDYDKRHVPYHLSKQALYTVTRMAALEYAPGIRVNAVAPGLILPPAGEDESYLERKASTNPLHSHGTAQDIVDAVIFLAGSAFVTGQVLFVDGGRNILGNVYG